jgi:hypothetical protein
MCASLSGVRGIAVAATVVLLAAGCGGAKHLAANETALLTGVDVQDSHVTFSFTSPPREVTQSYVPRSQLAESGSGKPVPLKGTAYVVVHFRPGATAVADAKGVTFTYTGPKRIEGAGPVLEVAKTSDFEADLAWAIGLERRLPVQVTRDGATVTLAFG